MGESPKITLLRDYRFGFTSAEAESARDPNLLTEGFLDIGGVVEEVTRGDKFLVIGNKGSGKSAIAEHLKLSSKYNTFVTARFLSDFPYSDLKTFVEGDKADQPFPIAWSWLLLVTLLGSFLRDQGGNTLSDPQLASTVQKLQTLGFLPTSNLNDLVLATSQKRQTRLELPVGFRIENESQSELSFHFPFFVAQLRTAMEAFRSSNQHLLILDGLDDVLSISPIQYESLAALLLESMRINDLFRQAGVGAKIVLLCPTDLFARLPGRNTNKILQDYSIRLDWYSADVSVSPLWELANLRASTQAGTDLDIRTQHFPRVLQSSGEVRVLPQQPADTAAFLLRYTRYTPRDFLRLLVFLQNHSAGKVIEPQEIAFALQEYATDYFISEVRDELGGYFSAAEIEILFTVFGTNRNALFSFDRIVSLTKDRMPTEKVREMLNALFDCSAIGNWERNFNPSRRTYRYKYPKCKLSEAEPIMLHPALSLALNVESLSEPPDENDSHIPKETQEKNLLLGQVAKLRLHDGFIRTDTGDQYHFYVSNVHNPQETRLVDGDIVTFRKGPLNKGVLPGATHIKLAPGGHQKLLEAPVIHGTVSSLKNRSGFIVSEGGRKYYFHLRNLVDPETKLPPGARVTFRKAPVSYGEYPTATNIELDPKYKSSLKGND